MWSGQLGFGLVMIPVKLFKATESHDVGFHQHHGPDCHGRIKQIRTCSECGAVVDYGDIIKGTETEDGQVVILTDDEMQSLQDEQGKRIDILQFVPAETIDPIMFESHYYVGTAGGDKAYALLTQAMLDSKLMAIGSFMLRNKTQLVALRVVNGVLTLHTLLWPDELRQPDEVPGIDGDYSVAEMKMAREVVKSMVAPFDPDSHTDHYQARLVELIAAKAAGGEFEPAAPAAQLDDVSDLLAALEASVKRHPAGKKRAAKKAPARKRVA